MIFLLFIIGTVFINRFYREFWTFQLNQIKICGFHLICAAVTPLLLVFQQAVKFRGQLDFFIYIYNEVNMKFSFHFTYS